MDIPEEFIEKAALGIDPAGHHKLCSINEQKPCDCYFDQHRRDATRALEAVNFLGFLVQREMVISITDQMIEPKQNNGTMPNVRLQTSKKWASRLRVAMGV